MILRASNEFKQECRENVTSARYATIHIKEDNKDITESNDLQSFEINASCYVNDKFIGTTVAKKITGKIFNDGQYNLENKNIMVKTGIKLNDNVEYENLDSYIIPKSNTEEVSEKSEFIGYDFMIKFDTAYIDRVNYPIRADDYLQDLCNQVGIILGSKDFINNDYMIIGNPFTNGETRKTVLSNIAQLALGFAVIEDEKLYIRSLDVNGEPIETIDGNNYTDFNPNNIFGPVNSFKIQMNSGVDGEESVRELPGLTDETRCQISISDNYFLNSQEQRELVIDKMFNAIKGLTYLPVKINYYGYPWLKLGSKLKVLDTKDKGYITYLMNHTFKYDGGYDGTIESNALTKTQSTYKSTKNIKSWRIQTELAVDKINGKITQQANEISEHNKKITKMEQDVSSITQQVSEIADITRTVIENNEVHITEAMSVEPSKFKIYGNSSYFKYLYPSDELYPSDNLYPTGDYFTLCVDKQSRNNPSGELKEYVINLEEPLRHLGDICDDFYVSNVDNTSKVIRRIGINTDGTLYVLENEVEEIIGELHLTLLEGENYIYVKEFRNLKYEIEYAILNDFTKQYAIKAEVNSKITQTSSQIMQEVNKKVDEKEFGTQLSLNYEALKLAWNQISQYLKMEGIDGKATLNIYDENNNILMSLSNMGQKFYRDDGTEIGDIGLLTDKEGKNQLVFSLNTESANDGMAWGIKNSKGEFFPIFQLVAFDYAEQACYGGYFQMVATLDMLNNEIKLMNTNIVGEVLGGITIYDENDNNYISLGTDGFSICNDRIKFYQNSLGSYTLDLCQNNITDVDNLKAETISARDVVADTVVETSVKEKKKYIKKTEKKALELIEQADICQYQLKGEKVKGYRHYGLVIGEGYHCPNEIVAQNKKGIDTYSMISIAWKAIQELSEENKQLKKELKEVKNEEN